MSMSDPIADMLTRMRNALEREHPAVSMPDSKIKRSIAQVMKDEGYIEDFQVLPATPQGTLRINLKYTGDRRTRESVVTAMERVSKPGRRVYVGRKEIPWVLNGMGIAIVSTPKGLMSGQKARRAGVGGEIICKVW